MRSVSSRSVKKNFSAENFSKSQIFDFRTSIKSEVLTRSSSKERR